MPKIVAVSIRFSSLSELLDAFRDGLYALVSVVGSMGQDRQVRKQQRRLVDMVVVGEVVGVRRGNSTMDRWEDKL